MRTVRHVQDSEIISTAEAASMLGCSVATVNRKAQAGDIEPVVQANGPTGARFYRRADIADMAATRRADIEAQLAAITEPEPAS